MLNVSASTIEGNEEEEDLDKYKERSRNANYSTLRLPTGNYPWDYTILSVFSELLCLPH